MSLFVVLEDERETVQIMKSINWTNFSFADDDVDYDDDFNR